MFLGESYVSEQGAEKIKSYKYSGEDRSLIYKYVLTPMNNYLIDFFPMNMAPNLITLIGVFCSIAAYCLYWYYCPTMQEEAPGWVSLFFSVMLFIYQTLDNLDGKQARRTGNSTALGLLFDHGIDALNATLIGMSLSSQFCFGPTWKSFTIVMLFGWGFYLNTWEHYYIEKMILPVVNGPTEGLLVSSLFGVVTFLFGQSFWLNKFFLPLSVSVASKLDLILSISPFHEKLVPQVEAHSGIYLEYHYIALVFFFIPAAVTLPTNMYTVYTYIFNNAEKFANKPKKHGKLTWWHSHPFLHALANLFVLFCISLFYVWWILVNPNQLLATYPRLVLWTFGLVFWKLCVHLMLAHLCDEEYHPFRRTFVPFFFCAMHFALHSWHGTLRDIDNFYVLIELFVVVFVSSVHMVFGVVSELCAILDVNCLTIKAKKSETNKNK